MAVPDIVHDACGIKDKNMRVPEYTEQGNALLTYWNRGTDFDWSQTPTCTTTGVYRRGELKSANPAT